MGDDGLREYNRMAIALFKFVGLYIGLPPS
jgi:hypothetical protein